MIAAPAPTVTVALNPAHTNLTASGSSALNCTGALTALTGHTGQDGWLFVLPSTADDTIISITLTMSTPHGDITAGPITSQNPSSPTTGPGWSGYLDSGGTGQNKHAYLFTHPGWTLTSGTLTAEPGTYTGTFNLKP